MERRRDEFERPARPTRRNQEQTHVHRFLLPRTHQEVKQLMFILPSPDTDKGAVADAGGQIVEQLVAIAKVAQLDGTPSVNVDKNWLAGIGNHITVVMKVDNKADRDQRLAKLTSAWFEDLKAYLTTNLVKAEPATKANMLFAFSLTSQGSFITATNLKYWNAYL